MLQKQKPQTFNDGVVNLYAVDNIAADGDKPKDGLVLKHESVRFRKKTVGVTRFWAASQNDVQVDKLIRIPALGEIKPGYVVIINGDTTRQYTVKQVQEPEDEYPPVLDLSLERLEQTYGTE